MQNTSAWKSVTIAVLGVVVLSAPASAQSPSAYKGYRITGFAVQGIEKPLSTALSAGLALAGKKTLLGRSFPIFFPDLLDADLKRTRLFLAREGYPSATVDPRFEGDGQDAIRIVWAVEPGAPTQVSGIAVAGAPEGVNLDPESLPLSRGARFTDARLDASRDVLRDRLRKAGYAQANVTAAVERRGREGVEARFHIDPGAEFTFGEVRVGGVTEDLAGLARRASGIPRGERFSPEPLARADTELRLLNLFRQIRIGTAPTGDRELDILVDLKPRKPRSFEAGVGYLTDERFRVHAVWQHRNLFRSGRGFRLGGSTSAFQQQIGASVWWPALLGSRTRVGLDGSFEHQDEESYDLFDTSVELTARYRPGLQTTVLAGVAVSNVSFTERTPDADTFQGNDGLLTIFSLSWAWNSADNPLFPTSGWFTSLGGEVSPPGPLSESHYARGESRLGGYVGLGGENVWASRVSVGLATPVSDTPDLLPNKRFFAGGATSMRGFKRRQLGPLDSDGAPTGGEARVEIGTELRLWFWGNLGAVLFADVGQVWERIDDLKMSQLEVAVGPGLTARTPVGPISLEIGYRLTDRSPEPDAVFHVLIGNPF